MAREAKVSIATVSNVLNHPDIVKEKTRLRVMDAIDKLHYIPNLNGKNLKSARSNSLALFLANIDGDYYSQLVQGINERCAESNYYLNIYVNNTNPADYPIQIILGRKVDGALVLNERVTADHVRLISKSRIPVVFLDREVVDHKITSVVSDGENGGYRATEHLIHSGCKKIYFMHGIGYDSLCRFNGYKRAMQRQGLPLVHENDFHGSFSKNIARSITADIIAGGDLPDAFFAANDRMAFGIVEVLIENGINVPGDIKVIGFDNSELCDYFRPKISSIDLEAKSLGKYAANCLLELLHEPSKRGELVKYPASLEIRESTRPAIFS